MAEKVEKERLDVLLVEKGLANSRELAKAYIMAGNVYVDGQKEDKAGTKVAVNADIEVKGSQMKYVSRGGDGDVGDGMGLPLLHYEPQDHRQRDALPVEDG